MALRYRTLFSIVGLSLVCSGCAQLGFLSGGFFDRGPIVLASCSDKPPLTPAPGGEGYVRPADCNLLDEAKAGLQDGNYPLAEEKFKKSIESFTVDETRRVDLRAAWFGLAAVYDEQRRFADADKAYAAIKSSFGEDARYLNNFGYSLYLRGNFAEAEKMFRSGLVLKPTDERILANLELVTERKVSTAPDAVPTEGSVPVPFTPAITDTGLVPLNPPAVPAQ